MEVFGQERTGGVSGGEDAVGWNTLALSYMETQG